LWLEIRRFFKLESLALYVIVTTVATISLIAYFKWKVPQFVTPSLWLIALPLPFFLLISALIIGTSAVLPRKVTIRTESIFQQQGDFSRMIDSKTVYSIRLIFHHEGRVRLRICYTCRSKPRSWVTGIPPTVDIQQLLELLPMEPIVRDARARKLGQQKSPEALGASGLSLL
jgi:hypothetical protein